ncbi:DUF4279 domain-containing protein [Streptomyces turgidiscabies]|nr:DUF4279 domain-containing protein [Streptomyces turgidiscabies]MDX3497999.1 DUF4279 domain-containing protein [Streptomyces turgidiscabies]GAQ69908.1 hypothetical protein T45_01639 [Streptomyces turgidiscabies]
MEMTNSWGAPQVALLITRPNLRPEQITEKLGMSPSFSSEGPSNSDFRSGESCWSIQVTGDGGQRYDELFEELFTKISPARQAILELHRGGYTVQLHVSGHVRGKSRTHLSSAVLSHIAAWELPVCLTTDTDPPARSEDDLDWLPAADGSHRDR